jgi:hypothetical protein
MLIVAQRAARRQRSGRHQRGTRAKFVAEEVPRAIEGLPHATADRPDSSPELAAQTAAGPVVRAQPAQGIRARSIGQGQSSLNCHTQLSRGRDERRSLLPRLRA